MFPGNIREDFHSHCRTSRSEPFITPSFSMQDPMRIPLTSSSTSARTSIGQQQSIMNYARMSYRYTTVTLLSMRPPPDINIFPDHLVERRFLDNENYIDLDRMLAEKCGRFRLESYDMRDGAGDGPMIPTRIHKYDFSDPVVIEKVKSRRPKDALTPHQVAALTSVVTRHKILPCPTPISSPRQNQPAPFETNKLPYPLPTLSSMPYQKQYSNQIQSHPSNYQQNSNTVPILERLFQAQQHSKLDVRNQQSLASSANTPISPERFNSNSTFAWPFSTNQKSVTHPLHIPISTQNIVKKNQDVLAQVINEQLRCSTTVQTTSSPNINQDVYQSDDEDDDQDFYSAPPSPTEQHIPSSTLFNNSNNPEHSHVYNQAALLNSLIRNMVNESDIRNSSSNESCLSNDTRSTNCNQEDNESYIEMYNLIRLLSPGIKNVAQQELLQYLEQGCLNDRNEMIRLIGSLKLNEQNSLKPVLLRMINEQIDIMKNQQKIQQGNSTLESWFGSDIYTKAYPRMPSDRVISACDLEQSRTTHEN